MRKELMLNFFIGLIIIYLVFGAFLYFAQNSLVYYPSNQDFYDCPGFSDYEKINYNGTRFYYNQKSSDNIIIFYHGNAGSACDRNYFRYLFDGFESSVMFVEYTGYSNDDKRPSKKLILRDVENINEFVKEKNYSNIIIYGESLGSGAASYQAKIGRVNHMIFISPFSSIKDIAKTMYGIYPLSLMLKENYDNVEWLQEYEGRLLILHAENDGVVPPRLSKKLYNKIPSENKERIVIEGRGHNDISLSPRYEEAIKNFLEEATS